MLFILSGPSGSGKSTLTQKVLAQVDNISFSASHTTRPKRRSELEGKNYYFISEKEFKNMIANKEFLEWAIVHGNYYGTSKKEIEEKIKNGDVLMDIDVQGARQIKSKFKEAIFIFVLPPSFEELKRRMVTRGEEESFSIQKRLEIAKQEIKCYKDFDYIIINDKLNKAVEELASIIIGQRCRRHLREEVVKKIIATFSEEINQ
ncbi:MAG: guanylate kinase [Candidatus Aminicenantia bacterium]